MDTKIIEDWKLLSKEKVSEKLNDWLSSSINEESLRIKACAYADNVLIGKFKNLRKDLLVCFEEAKKIENVVKKSSKYAFDLEFGLKAYRVFESYGFNSRYASIDQIWCYISLNVIPDIIIYRFYNSNNPEALHDHFWKKSRRIYPKTLWWYIYLALPNDGSSEIEQDNATRRMLLNNDTDTILQVIERSGDYGYRRDLYYEILKQYSRLIIKNPVPDFLRKVLILNTARSKVVEPALHTGGIPGYVISLFAYFGVCIE